MDIDTPSVGSADEPIVRPDQVVMTLRKRHRLFFHGGIEDMR
jgi:hypothetical protein